jgi:hypothetical protein
MTEYQNQPPGPGPTVVPARCLRYGDSPLPARWPGAYGEVQVWSIGLPGDGRETSEGLDVLDEDERARGRGFVRERDRARYNGAHIALRRLLGAYLAVAPHEVALTREACVTCGGPHGRPRVAPGQGQGRHRTFPSPTPGTWPWPRSPPARWEWTSRTCPHRRR